MLNGQTFSSRTGKTSGLPKFELFFNDIFYIENAGLSDFHAVILKRERQRRNTLRIFSNRPSEIIFFGKTNP